MKIDGIKVEDADEPIAIYVTKTDVRLGSKKDATACAAANAICRQTGAIEARVHTSRAYIKRGKKWLRYAVPNYMRDEIVAFDRGGEFAPGEYRLAPMQPSARLDAPPNPKGNHNGSAPKRRRRTKRAYRVASGVRDKMNSDWQ